MALSCNQRTGIVIADALPLFRSGLRHVLAQAFAPHLLHEAATAAELLATVGRQQPALVIMTSCLPDGPAEPGSLLSTLRELEPQVAVVVLIEPTTTPELAVLRLLRQNVNGVLLRTACPAEVCEAVGTVLQCGQYCGEYVLNLLRGQLHHRNLQRVGNSFSTRQLEVLRLIAEDYSNEEIADYLCTSVRTVEYHRSQMLQKAGTRTTLGLVLFAQRQGLLAVAAATPPAASRRPQLRLAKS